MAGIDDTVKELIGSTREYLSRLEVKELLQLQKNKAIEQGLPLLWNDFSRLLKAGLKSYDAGIAGTEYAEETLFMTESAQEFRVQRKYPKPYQFYAQLHQRKIDLAVSLMDSKSSSGSHESFSVEAQDNLDLFIKRFQLVEIIGGAEDLASHALRFMLKPKMW